MALPPGTKPGAPGGASSAAGTILGPYELIEMLGQGGMGTVWKARHSKLDKFVALKLLPPHLMTDQDAVGRFEREMKAVGKLEHAHIVRAMDAGHADGKHYLVMEYIEGTDLARILKQRGKRSVSEACQMIRHAALGLAHAHEHGLVHRDIKPSNLLLSKKGLVKILDLGLARLASEKAGEDGQLTVHGETMGTPDYMAPEQWNSAHSAGPAADLYSLGCTLFHLLTGKPPFAGDEQASFGQKMKAHALTPAPSLKTARSDVPPELEALYQSLLAKEPAERPDSAKKVADELKAMLSSWSKSVAAAASADAKRQEPGKTSKGLANETVAAKTEPAVPSERAESGRSALSIAVKEKPRVGSKADEILRRRRERQKRNLLIGIAAASLAIAALGGVGIWWMVNRPVSVAAGKGSGGVAVQSATSKVQDQESGVRNQESAIEEEDGSSAAGGSVVKGKAASAGKMVGRQQVVADDGKTLWASPTGGEPISFRCIPPEGQVFLALRPAAMLASDEGKRVLAALGPGVGTQRQAFEKASGFKLEEIDRLQITLHNNEGNFPRASFVVKPMEAVATEALLERWGQPTATKEKEETYYAGPTWAYYVSRAEEDKGTFALGDARDIKDVAADGGRPPNIPREIERVRRVTDVDRHFTLLFYPPFLFNDDGEPLFAAEREKVRQPLAWFLADDLQAASVSGHFGDEFYFEVRMRGTLDKEPYKLAEELRGRLEKTPAALEDYFVGLNPPTYWKKLAFRYPGMVRELYNQTRVGVEDQTAVVNGVLPATAAHNLVLGGELLVSTAPGQAVAATTAVAANTGPKSVAEALPLKTSFNFANQSLEFAMRDLAEDVKGMLKGAPFEFAIKIIGDDLKIEGITRNQSIRDFDQKDQTVADILTALVRKANPVTTVKDPSEKDQKLVWVIGPDPEGGKEAVLITTRAAAGAKKYVLPAVFVGKGK